MRLRKILIMLLVLASAVCFTVFAAGCSSSVYFEEDEYSVKNGDKITAVGKAEYKLIGDIPEGVSVAKDGTFTLSDNAKNGSQALLAAVSGEEVKDTAVCTVEVSLETPTLSFVNLTPYLVDGEEAHAVASPVYAVSYSLKNQPLGVTIDSVSGRVEYTDKVTDGQQFTVVASSHGVTVEKRFYAGVTDLAKIDNPVQFIERDTDNSVSYKVSFPNAEIERQGVIGITAGKHVAAASDFSYDSASKTVTVKSSFLQKFGQGETVLGIATAKNTAFATVKKATYIGSAEELASIGLTKEGVSGYYVLICDIDLTDYLKNKPSGWDAIGTYKDVQDGTALDMAFSGTFDGNGHTISGFFVNKTDVTKSSSFNTGLFGYVTRNGRIRNLNLVGATDAGYGVCSYSGALAGVNEGSITNCTTAVAVTSEGGTCIGGFVGKNLGEIKNCLSLLDATGEKDVGAFCGRDEGKIIDCYAVGTNQFSGNASLNNGVVYPSQSQLIANADFSSFSGWTVYSDRLPVINGVEIPVYLRDITITNARTQYIREYPLSLTLSVNPAGLTGYTVSYEVISGSGVTVDTNGKVDLTNAASGSYTVRAFVGDVSAEFTFSVSDNVSDLIVIRSVADFNAFKQNAANFDKEILLLSDLDFENAETTSIGYYYEDANGQNADYSATFSGIFNGNGHKIKNLKIIANAYGATTPSDKYHPSFYNVGLFSYVTGTVKNLTLENVNVAPNYNSEPTGNYIGVVCGTLRGSIQNCELTNCSYYGMDDSEIKSGWFTATENPNLSGCTVNGAAQ